MERDKLVETADGSKTVWSSEFGESYHSVSAGALEESLKKFLLPSHLPFLAENRREVSILEVGFGLGYNLTVSAIYLLKKFPDLKIRYVGLEKAINPLMERLKLPEPYGEFYEKLKENLFKGKTEFEVGPVKVSILLGDARRRILEIGETFDAVYHDAFSPKRNAELWTLHFLERIKRLLKKEGFWVSYSTALPVRKALFELGFRIFSTEPVGRRSPGTAATLEGKVLCKRVKPPTEKEKRKLETSPKAVPYLDPCLCLPREEILRNYLKEVSKREANLLR